MKVCVADIKELFCQKGSLRVLKRCSQDVKSCSPIVIFEAEICKIYEGPLVTAVLSLCPFIKAFCFNMLN